MPRKAKAKALPRGVHEYKPEHYEIYVTLPGSKRLRRRLGCVTLANAIDERSILRRQIAEDRIIHKRRIIPFSEICDDAVAYFQANRRDSLTATGRAKVIKEWFAGKNAEDITSRDIEEFLREKSKPDAEKKKRAWSPTTKLEYLRIIYQIYARAIEHESQKTDPALRINPAAFVKQEDVDNARSRILTDEEEVALRAQCNPVQNAILSLSLHTGARRSNLYGIDESGRAEMEPLTWRDVDLNWKVIHFPRSKNGKAYDVPMSETVAAAFAVLGPRESGPVLDTKSPRTWFSTAVRNAKLVDLHWHDLRRTFGHRLRAAGVRIEDIKALLGHSRKADVTENHYAVPVLDNLREAVAKLDPKKTGEQTAKETAKPEILAFRKAASA